MREMINKKSIKKYITDKWIAMFEDECRYLLDRKYIKYIPFNQGRELKCSEFCEGKITSEMPIYVISNNLIK